jgi:hypothetical protein
MWKRNVVFVGILSSLVALSASAQGAVNSVCPMCMVDNSKQVYPLAPMNARTVAVGLNVAGIFAARSPQLNLGEKSEFVTNWDVGQALPGSDFSFDPTFIMPDLPFITQLSGLF